MTHTESSADEAESGRSRRIRQVVNDCVRRRAAGETIGDETLIQSHPDLLPELADELRNLRLIQQAQHQADVLATVAHGGLRIRCPHCHNPVEVLDETSLSDVVCSSCGSHFSLVSDEPRMLLQQVLAEDAPRPRGLNRAIPKDLETICLKCLEKSPDQRYQTAALLRDDLDRYLRGEPLRARPISRPARAWRRCRRNRGLAALSVACLVALAALALIAYRYEQANRRARQVQWARQVAIPQAKRFSDQGDFVAAFQLTRKAERYIPGDPVLREMWPRIARLQSVTTDPPGAEVCFREYSATGGPWLRLGVTPIHDARFPIGLYR